MAVANLLKKGGVPKPKPKEPSKKGTSVASVTFRDSGLLPSRSNKISKAKLKTDKVTVLSVPKPDLWLDPQYSKSKELGSIIGGPGGNESTTSKRGKERLDMELKDIYESTTGKDISQLVLNKNLKDKYAKLVLLLKYKNSDYKTFALHTIKFGYVSTFYHDFLVFIGFKENNFKSYDNLFWYLIKDPQYKNNSFIKEQNQMIPEDQQISLNNISKSRQPSQVNQMMQSMSSQPLSQLSQSRSRSVSRSQSPSTQVMQNSENQSSLDLITLLEKISITKKNNSIVMANSDSNNNNNNNNNRQNAALNAQIEEITNGMRRTGINTNRLTIDNINDLFGQMRIKRII